MLRKEYQEIVNSAKIGSALGDSIAEEVARQCQALADRPKKQLTNEEIQEVLIKSPCYSFDAMRKVCAAYDAKQKKPEKVRIRIVRDTTGRVSAHLGNLTIAHSVDVVDDFEHEIKS